MFWANALSMGRRRQKQEQMTTWSQVKFARVLFRTDPWGGGPWGGWSVGSWSVVAQILSILVSHENQNPKGFQKVRKIWESACFKSQTGLRKTRNHMRPKAARQDSVAEARQCN
jgi:hypothetical protein